MTFCPRSARAREITAGAAGSPGRGALACAAIARFERSAAQLPVARRFLAEYDRALERIRDHPERWPIYPHVPGGFRWCRFRRFPYAMIYELFPNVTHVLAVAADRRMPGYWADRR